MQIDRIFYPITTLGYGNRLGIWTIGCIHECPGCSNPELWEFRLDKEVSILTLINVIRPFFSKIDGITITGGEPFCQIKELHSLIECIRKGFKGDILVYTGFTIDELQNKDAIYKNTLEIIDILIDGPYIDKLNNNIGLAGSSNQKIHRLNNQFATRYIDCEYWPRKSQIFEFNQRLFSIGIPLNYKV